jgi:hypothetical protein
MSNDITQVSISDIERMALAVAKSGMFGVRTPEQATALMLIAQAEGLHPAIAARDYHVIQGRPALRADAMLARFQAAGGRVEWLEHSDTKVSARFSHPSGGSVVIDWTFERAKNAGLTGKETWRAYPRQMLRSRVISEGVRAVFPGVAVGTYTVEEVQDMSASPGFSAGSTASLDPVEDVLAASDMDALKTAYVAAVKGAKKAKDDALLARIEEAKERRKKELTAIPAESTEVIENG